jgi:uncharacterized protein YecT (DUF1311 family)
MKVIARVTALLLIFAISRALAAANWPEGYVVHENTESPDGRYGIIVPGDESTIAQGESVNYLAKLKTHQTLGKIKGSDYFEHQNHAGLNVIWAEDSSWCVAEYQSRFGFASISILEPKDSTFTDTDIGEKIDKALAAVIRKQSHESDEGGGAAVTYFRLGDDRKLRVRVASTTDPKQISERGGYYALFQGTFDVRTKKWLATDARSLKRDEYEAADTAFSDLDTQLASTSFEMQDKGEWLDERLNEVYTMLRVVLPQNRFAKVKQEQMDWLKKRDAASTPEDKKKMIDARIRELQELLW